MAYLVPPSEFKHVENSAYGKTRVAGGSGAVKIQMERHDGLELFQWIINLDLGYGPWVANVCGFARFERESRRHKFVQRRDESERPMSNRQAVKLAIEHLPKFITVRED